MKKIITFALILTCVAVLAVGCGQVPPTPESSGYLQPTTGGKEKNTDDPIKYDRRPMVMVNGNLYYDTGKESDIVGRCGVMDGKIKSTVDNTEIPTKDDQSNFGDGYEYQHVSSSSIDILMNEKWIRFEQETKSEIIDYTIEIN